MKCVLITQYQTRPLDNSEMHVSLKTVLYFCSQEKKASEKKVLNIC